MFVREYLSIYTFLPITNNNDSKDCSNSTNNFEMYCYGLNLKKKSLLGFIIHRAPVFIIITQQQQKQLPNI